ncbi:hypothetical protein Pure01_19300 [Paenarthrobacter ureafaciens]|nr:hypothetical protein Pure01_19300 [Paenarthrobacter ureafaciens]GLU67960.1 hypothetical protein Pure03_19360 [Paenarthrobacter ureafaciens]
MVVQGMCPFQKEDIEVCRCNGTIRFGRDIVQLSKEHQHRRRPVRLRADRQLGPLPGVALPTILETGNQR